MKKYLAMFLIFFLLFGFSCPAFASTSTVLPPVLDSTEYNSFAVIDAYYFDPFEMENPVSSYVCYLYDSSDWEFFYVPDTNSVRFRLVSYSDAPKDILWAHVPKSSYDSSTVNNGWGTFSELRYNDYNINGSVVYSAGAQFSFNSLDYYDSETGTLLRNPVLLSNRDVYVGSWSSTSGADISNEVFFSPTPPLVVATGEALTLFQTQTIQTIMTIVPFGVGCLAFLISLVILRKVLLRFLNR